VCGKWESLAFTKITRASLGVTLPRVAPNVNYFKLKLSLRQVILNF